MMCHFQIVFSISTCVAAQWFDPRVPCYQWYACDAGEVAVHPDSRCSPMVPCGRVRQGTQDRLQNIRRAAFNSTHLCGVRDRVRVCLDYSLTVWVHGGPGYHLVELISWRLVVSTKSQQTFGKKTRKPSY
jgi:hypothetical protein